ncbi:ORF102 [Staphylococcus phage 96]|uniref:ORF102 n=1 Tax=Staphylococcus phage 96 TaxID=2936815 RepID=Q4ZBY0_9CAUD|nr:ORF102 [Staphylococcus phage 96]AAX91490.1 ORF102 [Staphylococcus phage 96]
MKFLLTQHKHQGNFLCRLKQPNYHTLKVSVIVLILKVITTLKNGRYLIDCLQTKVIRGVK